MSNATDAMSALSALVGMGGHLARPLADRVVGPGRNDVNGARGGSMGTSLGRSLTRMMPASFLLRYPLLSARAATSRVLSPIVP